MEIINTNNPKIPNLNNIYGIKCPLSLDVFKNPCVAADGHTYEREQILTWFNKFPNNNAPTSPMTLLPLKNRRLMLWRISSFSLPCPIVIKKDEIHYK